MQKQLWEIAMQMLTLQTTENISLYTIMLAPPHPLPFESFRIDPQKQQAEWIDAGKPRQCVMGLMAG